MAEQLTAKQAAFRDYYGDPASETYNNQYASAIKAGYSPKTAQAACKDILGNPRVQQAVEVKRAELRAAMDISREEVTGNARWLVDFGKRKENGADVRAGNEQLVRLGGHYREAGSGNAGTPTITVNLAPEPDKTPEQRRQEIAERQVVRLHDAG